MRIFQNVVLTNVFLTVGGDGGMVGVYVRYNSNGGIWVVAGVPGTPPCPMAGRRTRTTWPSLVVYALSRELVTATEDGVSIRSISTSFSRHAAPRHAPLGD